MLDIIIFFGIVGAIQVLLIDLPIKNKIKRAQYAEEAIALRERAKKWRLTVFGIALVLFIVYTFIPVINTSGRDLMAGALKIAIVDVIIIFWFLLGNKALQRYTGIISSLSNDQFLDKYPRFALYLRGFESDDYSKRHAFQKHLFSEYHFMRLLKTRIRVCAVGMTKELDSPDGAIRVYVNDNTWQDNVRELMEKAQEIYILINDRDSCLWEIEQSASMQSKTTYIVSDLDKYNRARSALKDSLEFPPIVPDEKYEDAFFSLTHDGSAFKVDSFPNDLEGYNLVAHGHIQQVYHRDRLRKEIATGWAVIFGPATLFVLASVLYYLCDLIFHFESDTHMAIIAFSIPVVFLALVLYQYFSYIKAHRVKESE